MPGTQNRSDLPFLRAPRPTRILRWLTALGIAVAAGTLALGTLVLWDSRDDAWRRAEQASANLALALGRDIARDIAVYDLALQGVAEALRHPGINDVDPELRRMALFDRAATAGYLGSMLVIDARGDVILASTSARAPSLNLADRDYFRAQRDRPDAGLFISRPFRSRLRQGDLSIALSRRLPDIDGQFTGIVIGALRLAYFQDLFASLDLGPGGSVTLFRIDGRIIARHPFNEADIDRDLSDSENFRRFAGGVQSGSFVGQAAIDGVRRLYSFRRIGDQPLLLSVATSVDHVYRAWRLKAIGIGAILIFLCSTSVALSLVFRRELLRRVTAEAALAEAAEHLSVMATTDGLTGLTNRRQFDATLSREWRRAIRDGAPLSLLMFDADNFKFYNDHYGHQEGDRVLRGIADCVRKVLHRPGDTGARYGGEEFAVLLPETDAIGALGVADQLRSLVEGLGIPHAGRPEGCVTISIGVVTTLPRADAAESVLVQAADEALYAAKRDGRNRVASPAGGDVARSSPIGGRAGEQADWRRSD